MTTLTDIISLCAIIFAIRYFPDLKNVTTDIICVDADTPEVVATLLDLRKGDLSIIGGGGLLDHSDRWNFALKHYCQITTCTFMTFEVLIVELLLPRLAWSYSVICVGEALGILWAPGRNRHHSHRERPFLHTAEQILQAAAVGRTRDYHLLDEPAPLLDPSCMLSGLQWHDSPKCAKTRGVGFYLHAKLAVLKKEEVERMLHGVDPQDVLFNNELDINEVLEFLCRHEVVVTSSYHGVLWATYMNIPVYTVFDFSEKFANLPFTVRQYPYSEVEEGNRPALSTALYVDGLFLKEQCIQQNEEFYETFVHPFVTVLHSLASPPPPLADIIVRKDNDSDSRRWDSKCELLPLSDFNLRDIVSTVAADCSPLNRNHVYDRLNMPKFETNLYVKFDSRYNETIKVENYMLRC